tara:strand:+ start:18119 stop:19588 length:1470 start_codon:yes stop_codon:yes gene_type:complete
MKKLFLHIGLGKTGSSALQSWLSLNADALSKQGVDYADLVPHAKTGEVSSGNGYVLQQALIGQDFEEVERLLTSTYFFNPKNNIALISCELFQGIRAPLVQKIHDICTKLDIDVTVIVYIRSVYEQQYSSYLQGIKRSSIAHPFGEKSSDIAFLRYVEYLRRYVRVFGDQVLAVNYDIAKKNIYASLADIVGIETQGLKKLKKKVNRSLTLEEAEVLRRMNGMHGGVFATITSDYVIKLSPNIESLISYDKSLLQRVRDITEEDLLWVNEQFGLVNPVVSDFYDGQSPTESISLTRESYKPVMRWAMDFSPPPALRQKFATFLQLLTDFMADISVDDMIALKNKLHRVEFELEEAPEQEGMEEEAKQSDNNDSAPASTMTPQIPTHIITYTCDAQAMNAEKKAQIDEQFNNWLASLAEHAVGGAMNAVANTTVLRGANADTLNKESTMTGYTLITTEDTEAVLCLAKKCPLLGAGGIIEVSRTGSFFGT